MTFNPGDKVKFLNETGGGTFIIYLSKTQALIELETGFEIAYEVKFLVPVNDNYNKPTLEQSTFLENPKDQKSKPVAKKKASDFMEIDLHIHELINSYRHLSNYEILQIQLNYFKRKLEEAQRARIKRMVVIHGVGEGVLKHEIIKVLADMTHIEFYEASYRNYGKGATEIRFH